MRRGVGLIVLGLIKKVFIADVFAHLANEAFAAPEHYGSVGLLSATYAFAIQIYCDFSGYTDIALGSALLLGVRLPNNFDAPYLAVTLRDFWRRWHISLSTWLRDYLYIPLGGSRHGTARLVLALTATMVLGGLWHGAGWNWVAWGLVHGVVLGLERLARSGRERRSRVEAITRWMVTFHLVLLTWILFRATDLASAWTITTRIFTLEPGDMPAAWSPFVAMALLLAAQALHLKRRWLHRCERHPRGTAVLAAAALVFFPLVFSGAPSPEFIYFQF